MGTGRDPLEEAAGKVETLCLRLRDAPLPPELHGEILTAAFGAQAALSEARLERQMSTAVAGANEEVQRAHAELQKAQLEAARAEVDAARKELDVVLTFSRNTIERYYSEQVQAYQRALEGFREPVCPAEPSARELGINARLEDSQQKLGRVAGSSIGS